MRCSGSSTRVVGNTFTFHVVAAEVSRSRSTVKRTGTFFRNSLIRGAPSPKSTARIAKGLPASLSCSRCIEGISSRQGSHQVAQKLITTTLPRGDALYAAAAGQARRQALRDPRGGLRRGRAADQRVPEESPGALHGAPGSRHLRGDGVEGEGTAHDPGARSRAAHPLLCDEQS